MVIATVILIGWDIFVVIEPVSGDTISEIMFLFAERYWVLPLMYSGLGAHFFIPKKGGTEWGYTIALWVLWAVCIMINIGHGFFIPWWVTIPVGFFLGWLLWGQAKKRRGKAPSLGATQTET